MPTSLDPSLRDREHQTVVCFMALVYPIVSSNASTVGIGGSSVVPRWLGVRFAIGYSGTNRGMCRRPASLYRVVPQMEGWEKALPCPRRWTRRSAIGNTRP